ncbi:MULTISPECIES: hypothetical protein [unclassified Lebetimonas]|nr:MULTISPECIES: hypothetical protein [unclassified Lebetimonas]
MITDVGDNEVKLKALEAGVNEFLNKPINTAEIIIRLKNSIKMIKSNKILKEYNKTLQEEVKKATFKLEKAQFETLDLLSTVAEYRDEDTHLHTKRRPFIIPCQLGKLYHNFKASSNLPSKKIAS